MYAEKKITFSKKSIKNFQKEIEARTIKSNSSTKKAIRDVNKYLYEGHIVDSQRFGWGAYFLTTVNVTEDLLELNKFAMDCIRAVDSGKTKVGGLGENLQMNGRVVCRGTGKNVTANIKKWIGKYGYVKVVTYLTLLEMRNALRMGKSIYASLLYEAMM